MLKKDKIYYSAKFWLIQIAIAISFVFATDEVSLDFTTITEESIELTYNSSSPIYGFQFKVSGVDIVNVSNDVLVTQIGSEFIIGFSFTNDFLTSGSGILAEFTFLPTYLDRVISITDIIASIADYFHADIINLPPLDKFVDTNTQEGG